MAKLMYASFKYRAYPTEDQVLLAMDQFAATRWAFNFAVKAQRHAVSKGQPVPPQRHVTAQIAEFKATESGEWLQVASSVSLQQAVAHAYDGRKRHLTSLGTKNPQRAPHLKKLERGSSSMTFTRAAGFGVPKDSGGRHETVRVPRLGDVPVRLHRPLPENADPGSMTFTREPDGRWYVVFPCETEAAILPDTEQVAGVDLGISTFASIVEIDQTKGLAQRRAVENPKVADRLFKRITRTKELLALKVPGSKGHTDLRMRLVALYAQGERQRSELHHKTAADLVRNNRAIAIETLRIRTMSEVVRFSAKDASMRSFGTTLEHHARKTGREIVRVGQFVATSRICSVCGVQGSKKELSLREWTCQSCGAMVDRDFNAALIILSSIKVGGGLSRLKTPAERALGLSSSGTTGTHVESKCVGPAGVSS